MDYHGKRVQPVFVAKLLERHPQLMDLSILFGSRVAWVAALDGWACSREIVVIVFWIQLHLRRGHGGEDRAAQRRKSTRVLESTMGMKTGIGIALIDSVDDPDSTIFVMQTTVTGEGQSSLPLYVMLIG